MKEIKIIKKDSKEYKDYVENLNDVEVAIRFSADIARDFARGFSIAGWGCVAASTEDECWEEYPDAFDVAYVEELGGWFPILDGLCAMAIEWDEDFESALATCMENAGRTYGSEVEKWYAFLAEDRGQDEYGEQVVKPKSNVVIEL